MLKVRDEISAEREENTINSFNMDKCTVPQSMTCTGSLSDEIAPTL